MAPAAVNLKGQSNQRCMMTAQPQHGVKMAEVCATTGAVLTVPTDPLEYALFFFCCSWFLLSQRIWEEVFVWRTSQGVWGECAGWALRARAALLDRPTVIPQVVGGDGEHHTTAGSPHATPRDNITH